MVRISASALTLALSISVAPISTSAFTQNNAIFGKHAVIKELTTANMAATLEQPPLAPLTIWGDEIRDIRSVQKKYNSMPAPDFAPTIHATKDLKLASNDVEGQLAYIRENAMAIKQKMEDNGAVIFRGFDLMKTQEGFVQFYEAVGMKVCLDPLHSVSARPTVDGQKNSPVYEAVNKESRKNFFIGECSLLYKYNRLSRKCTSCSRK